MSHFRSKICEQCDKIKIDEEELEKYILEQQRSSIVIFTLGYFLFPFIAMFFNMGEVFLAFILIFYHFINFQSWKTHKRRAKRYYLEDNYGFPHL